MKKNLILIGLVIVLGLYAYTFIYKKEQSTQIQRVSLVGSISEIEEIRLTTENGEIELKHVDGLWWVEKPHHYLADQEFIERALTAMVESPSENTFVFSEDLYGVKPGRAFFELIYKSGERKRLIVGSKEAPANRIYILNSDMNTISVVHNLWVQFLHYPTSMFYLKSLPISGHQFKGARLLKGSVVQWSLQSKSKDMANVQVGDIKAEVAKAKLLWFFRGLKDFDISKLQFGVDAPKGEFQLLEAESEKGIITFHFYEKDQKVYIPELKVFADYDPNSLNSLRNELKKVIPSDKK